MAFAERLLAHDFGMIPQRWTERDAILYALGVGLGADPVAPADLAYLYERDLRVLPSFAVTLASPGLWVKAPELGIDWVRLVHAAQSARFLAPLPAQGAVIGHARIASVVDRGRDRGAEVVVERRIVDAATGTDYCILEQTLLLRGNGGFSDAPVPRPPRPVRPARDADLRVTVPVSPRAALIYRLSGDWNQLHVDPQIAGAAGFPRPILHGLASYGIAGWVVLSALADGDPTRLTSLSLRFAAPVTPGDRLAFELWRDGSTVEFIARVDGKIVLDDGRAAIR